MISALGSWVQDQLQRHDWTPVQAARQLRLDPKTVRALINGPARGYDPRTLKKLADGLGVEEAELQAIAGESKYDRSMRTRLENDPDYNAHWAVRVHAARRKHPGWTQKMTASPGYRESRHSSAVKAGIANRDAHTTQYFKRLGHDRWRTVVKRNGLAAEKKRFLMVRQSGNPGPRRPEVAAVLAARMTSEPVRLSRDLGVLYKKVILRRPVTQRGNPPDSLRRQMHGREQPRRPGGVGPRKGGRPRHQILPSDPYELLGVIARVVRAVDVDRLTLATVANTIGRAYGWKTYPDAHGNPRCEKAGEVYRLGKALDALDPGSDLSQAWAAQKTRG